MVNGTAPRPILLMTICRRAAAEMTRRVEVLSSKLA
jgi:superfamily I DNA/RNA helicase